jgi:hypothetical protein
VFCTQCGQQNPADARFCARCGAAQTEIQSDPSAADTTSALSVSALQSALDTGSHQVAEADPGESAAEGLPTGSALLVVRRGPNAGSRFLLDADVTTAGRHPESDIFLDDVTVSRRHAEFAREGEGFVVRDSGSLNGTYLNRERIERAVLAGGDEVQIGKYRLVYLAGTGEG